MLTTVIVSTVSLIALQVLLVVKVADRLSPQSGVRSADEAAPLSTAGRFAGFTA